MARARNIKPGFFKNEVLGTSDPFVMLLFAGLWTLADKSGILEDRPLRIKAELFPYRENFDINGYLTVLQREDFIHRYEVNGLRLIQVVKFKDHQNPHHTEKDSIYPDYSEGCVITVIAPLNNRLNPADSLIPDSLIPDSLKKHAHAKKLPATKFFIDIDPNLYAEYLAVRKAKRAPSVSETVEKAFLRESKKAGITVSQAMRECVERNWIGFRADWYCKQSTQKQTLNDVRADTANQMFGGMNGQGRIIDVSPRSYANDRPAISQAGDNFRETLD